MMKLDLTDLQPPETIDAAVDRLMVVLDDTNKSEIRVLKEDKLINMHFSLGLSIRNAFIHNRNNQLLKSCDTVDPDEASYVIIKALWKKLNQCT